MTNARVRKVSSDYAGGVFERDGDISYIYSTSPRHALEIVIDDFIENLGQEPEDMKIEFIDESHARLYMKDSGEEIASFHVWETAELWIGMLGSLDLNDPEILSRVQLHFTRA